MNEGPVRTCVGCRVRRPQTQLIRVVRRPDGTVEVDAEVGGRSSGRGAYVCSRRACAERALGSGRLARALRCKEHDRLEELRTSLLARIERRTNGKTEGSSSR